MVGFMSRKNLRKRNTKFLNTKFLTLQRFFFVFFTYNSEIVSIQAGECKALKILSEFFYEVIRDSACRNFSYFKIPYDPFNAVMEKNNSFSHRTFSASFSLI